jgi:hypothetical protein
MIKKDYIRVLYIFIALSFAVSIMYVSSSYETAFAKKDKDDEDKEEKDKDQVVVNAQINLENVDMKNTKLIRVTAFINGEDFKQDVPISSIDKSKKKVEVELKTDVKNDVVEADTPDEFFVCAYQVGDVLKDYKSLTKFDCNEGDLLSTSTPTEIELFKSGSQVYAKSQAVYAAHPTNINNPNSDKVKIKILAPLADKKGTEKLVIGAMIKGQIQSEVIEDVQAELDKSKDNTIKRTFTFDRKTDIGLIQVGDRYHACVSGDDLRPPEGTECEKRVIKQFDKPNSLPAR